MEKKKLSPTIVIVTLAAIAAVIVGIIIFSKSPTPQPPQPVTHTVTFMDGDKKVGEVEVEEGKALVDIELPAVGTKEGYEFGTWKYENEENVDYQAAITADMTLHTYWIDLASVVVYPTNIKLEKTSFLIAKGKTAQINVVLEPVEATDSIFYSSADEKVAKVDSMGKITAVGNGTTTITVETGNGLKTKATVEVHTPVTSITLTADREVIAYDGVKQANISVQLSPSDANAEIVWTTSGADVNGVNGSYAAEFSNTGAVIYARELSKYNQRLTITATVTNKDGSKATASILIYAEKTLVITKGGYDDSNNVSGNDTSAVTAYYAHGETLHFKTNENATFTPNSEDFINQEQIKEQSVMYTVWNERTHQEGFVINIETEGGQKGKITVNVNNKK